MKTITKKSIDSFHQFLIYEEKSPSTLKKYIHDVCTFAAWLEKRAPQKSLVLEYKANLIGKFAPASVNSILSSLNSFFEFCDLPNLKVKLLKIQRQIFTDRNHELSKEEYGRLLNAAYKKENKRLYYLMQTICSTGIRVSELRFITVDAIHCGQAHINCKGKLRTVILPKQLCKMLLQYIKERKIKNGCVFVTKNGTPLDRSNIWAEMKKLCESAGVDRKKVFPHNLRHLFARTYYSIQKDIVRLADILGHSSINTTRIYTIESGAEHRRQIQELGLLIQKKIPHN